MVNAYCHQQIVCIFEVMIYPQSAAAPQAICSLFKYAAQHSLAEAVDG
jgi:hypothetical protein